MFKLLSSAILIVVLSVWLHQKFYHFVYTNADTNHSRPDFSHISQEGRYLTLQTSLRQASKSCLHVGETIQWHCADKRNKILSTGKFNPQVRVVQLVYANTVSLIVRMCSKVTKHGTLFASLISPKVLYSCTQYRNTEITSTF